MFSYEITPKVLDNTYYKKVYEYAISFYKNKKNTSVNSRYQELNFIVTIQQIAKPQD